MIRPLPTSPSRPSPPAPSVRRSLLLFFGFLLAAAPALGGVAIDDPSLFPPELFPGLSDRTEDEVLLSGMHALYPKRILRHEPREETETGREPAAVPLDTGGTYVRVYDLAAALPTIEKALSAEALFLDLRYVRSDLPSALSAASLLSAQSEVVLERAGLYPTPDDAGQVRAQGAGKRDPRRPVFVLTNAETSGPIEAVLHELKAAGEVISLGRATAGGTGSYAPAPSLPGFRLIRGEIQPAGGPSLVETGFIPAIPIEAGAEDERAAYAAFEAGTDLMSLIAPAMVKVRYDEASLMKDFDAGLPRQIPGAVPAANGTGGGDDAPPPRMDLALQRAVQIFQALQALGRVPPA